MKSRKKIIKSAAVVVTAVAAAYICHMLDYFGIGGQVFGFIRMLIYLSLFTVWMIRIKCTVQQQATRRYLLAAGGLMIFWLYMRSIKLEFLLPPVGMRICWYLYYIPMLFIPVTALLASLTIGKADNERLSTKTTILWLVSTAFLLFVLTNDLHQLVFRFPADIPLMLRSDREYSYGPVYFAAVIWMTACGIASLTVMYRKCRMPDSKKYFRLALVPVVLALIYTAAYCAGFSWLRFWLGDMTIVHCLLFAATFEWCIICGMIRSNSRYFDLFEGAVDCAAQIADKDFCICYSAHDARPVTEEQMKKALKNPVQLTDGNVLHVMPISGGYAIWTEDYSDLMAQEEELKYLKEEWQERNALLRSEYTMEEKRRKVLEQNRLYDLLQAVTQKQLDRIALLMQAYQGEERNSDSAKEILAKIAVLCSYMKRRKHIELIADRDYTVSRGELKMAFSESLRTLRLLGAESSLFIDTKKQLSGADAAKLYDFFEDVIEADMDGLRSLDIRIVQRSEGLRMIINVECDADLSALREQYRDAEFDDHDGEQTCMLTLRSEYDDINNEKKEDDGGDEQ